MLITQMANNQIVINTKDGVYFQSYDSIVAFKGNDGKVVLGKDYRYSRTTMKYLIQFLDKDSIKEVDALVKNGTFKIDFNLSSKE